MEIRFSRILLIVAVGTLLWISKDYLWLKGTQIISGFPEIQQSDNSLSEYTTGR
ncbi:MAG: hypothetical protein MI976_23055 [Pseudomonadales bacterium]|nr:hypothetical protein [Pseudomonadales bacterium]